MLRWFQHRSPKKIHTVPEHIEVASSKMLIVLHTAMKTLHPVQYLFLLARHCQWRLWRLIAGVGAVERDGELLRRRRVQLRPESLCLLATCIATYSYSAMLQWQIGERCLWKSEDIRFSLSAWLLSNYTWSWNTQLHHVHYLIGHKITDTDSVGVSKIKANFFYHEMHRKSMKV